MIPANIVRLNLGGLEMALEDDRRGIHLELVSSTQSIIYSKTQYLSVLYVRMLYPVISIRDAADTAEDEKLLFSPEQVDQIITNCLHEIAATYENDAVTRRDIGTSYARYIQTLLIGRVSGRSRGRKTLPPEPPEISPTVSSRSESEHTPSIKEPRTSLEPVPGPSLEVPPVLITPTLPAEEGSPPSVPLGPPPVPPRPRPRLAPGPLSTSTNAIGSPDILPLGSPQRPGPSSIHTSENGNATNVTGKTVVGAHFQYRVGREKPHFHIY